MLDDPNADVSSLNWSKTNEDFYVVGHFDDNGIAKDEFNHKVVGKVKQLRILVGKNHKNWAILSEMHVKTIEQE